MAINYNQLYEDKTNLENMLSEALTNIANEYDVSDINIELDIASNRILGVKLIHKVDVEIKIEI